MDPDAVAPLIGFLGFGACCLLALRMFLNYRIRRLQAHGSGAPSRELEEAVGELKDQMYVLRGDLTELQERVEFAERVLARGRDDARLPGGH
jgi:hypothetical protein